MDERTYPGALEAKSKRYQNSGRTGLATKAHRLAALLLIRSAPKGFALIQRIAVERA